MDVEVDCGIVNIIVVSAARARGGGKDGVGVCVGKCSCSYCSDWDLALTRT